MLKRNSNQRYATNAISAALFRWAGVWVCCVCARLWVDKGVE